MIMLLVFVTKTKRRHYFRDASFHCREDTSAGEGAKGSTALPSATRCTCACVFRPLPVAEGESAEAKAGGPA
jgi:hypothetical protein